MGSVVLNFHELSRLGISEDFVFFARRQRLGWVDVNINFQHSLKLLRLVLSQCTSAPIFHGNKLRFGFIYISHKFHSFSDVSPVQSRICLENANFLLILTIFNYYNKNSLEIYV